MPNFYCKHSNDSGHGGHPPHPGERVTAADAQAAALAFATSRNLVAGIKVSVIDEAAVQWFVTGGIAPITPPAYT